MKRLLPLLTVLLSLCGGITLSAQTRTETTVWDEGFDSGDWTNELILSFNGAHLAADDQLIFKYSTSGGGQMQFGYKNDDETETYTKMLFSGNDWVDIPTNGTFTLTLNDEWAKALNEGKAFRLKGKNFFLSKIIVNAVNTEGLPQPPDPDAGKIKTVLDDNPQYSPTNWEAYIKSYNTLDGVTFFEGDVIRLEITKNGNPTQLQYGFDIGKQDDNKTTPAGYTTKKDGENDEFNLNGITISTNHRFYYRKLDKGDYTENVGTPYEITLDNTLARELNTGAGFLLRGTNFTLNKVTLVQPEKRRGFVWVPLFIPNEYPTGTDITAKNEYGVLQGEEKGNPKELTNFIGFSKVVTYPENVEATDGRQKYAVKFASEWWSTGEITSGEADYQADKETACVDFNKTYFNVTDRASELFEENTWPLRILRENTPNFALLKVGDVIRIRLTVYDINKNGTKTSQANLGTYKPDNINQDDPMQGYTAITTGYNDYDGPQSYRDFGSNDGEEVIIDYTVGPIMLNYITRYGLAINGRGFYLNSVEAKIYEDFNETDIEGHDTQQNEYFYTVKVNPTDIADLNLYELVKIKINDGTKYNECRESYFKDSYFLGTRVKRYDESLAIPTKDEDNYKVDDEFRVMIRYYEEETGLYGNKSTVPVRMHRASYLYDDHFHLTKEGEQPTPANAPARDAQEGRTFPNPKIVPVTDDFIIETSTETGADGNEEYYYGFRVTTPEMLDIIKSNGVEIRGQKYNAEYTGIDRTLTGIAEVEIEPIDYNAPYEVYNLQGMRVSEPQAGSLYIVRQGNKVEKVIIR